MSRVVRGNGNSFVGWQAHGSIYARRSTLYARRLLHTSAVLFSEAHKKRVMAPLVESFQHV